MPKQKRWKLKQELDYAKNGIQRAQEHVAIAGKAFGESHLEYSEPLLQIHAALTLVVESINQVRDRI